MDKLVEERNGNTVTLEKAGNNEYLVTINHSSITCQGFQQAMEMFRGAMKLAHKEDKRH